MSDNSLLRRCRHCASFSFEDRVTYASVLVAGSSLLATVESLEQRIIPCVTAVCPECDQVSLISDGSTESVICSIFMWQRLREWIDTDYGAMSSVEVQDSIGGGVVESIKQEEEVDSSLEDEDKRKGLDE